MIQSHSLHQSNMVFLFKETVVVPENKEILELFGEGNAKGMNFVDNSVMQAKLLNVPKIGLTVVWEGRRLRIEDQLSREPGESPLVAEAIKIYNKLFASKPPSFIGFGFNFDIYYKLSDVVRIHDFFTALSPTGLAIEENLLDFGWQWTTADKSGKQLNGYFLKVTAPLELAVHHNAHFNQTNRSALEEAQKLFLDSFEKTHLVIGGLVL